MEPLQALLTETAVLTGPFDLQQPMVDVPGNLFEVGQVFEILADPEIEGIVDGAFSAGGAAFLEVLLQIEALVTDVEAGSDAVGEDAGGEFAGGAPGDGTFEDQRDTVGTAQIEVFADDFLEELATMDGPVEDLGEGEFHLRGTQFIAGLLQSLGSGAFPEAIVESFEADALVLELAFGPLVAMETDLDGIRGVGADRERSR